MVTTTHYLATDAGNMILEQGGNAFDAACAVQLALAVVQPHSTGLGGGGFALLYHSSNKTVTALDGREEAPAKYHGRIFCRNNDCIYNSSCDCSTGTILGYNELRTGGLSNGVPGTVALVDRILREHGSMTWAQVAAPAIKYARDGFEMYQRLYNEIVLATQGFRLFEASKKLFLDPTGTRPICEVGQTFYNPDIASTLEFLSQPGGVADFYTGGLAEEIVAANNNATNPSTGKFGLLSLSDFQLYRAVERPALVGTYRQFNVNGMPPPGGNVVIQHVLNLLEAYDIPRLEGTSPDYAQIFVDAQNMAFADRAKYLADPDFEPVPTEGLISKSYARSRREELMSFRIASAVPVPIAPGNPPGASEDEGSPPFKEEYGTTHFNVKDKDGNVVSFTSTIEGNMGSFVVVPGRGFLLNNEMTDFERYEADEEGNVYANAPEGLKLPRRTAMGDDKDTLGGKRPRSSMVPIIVTDSESNFVMAIGSPGGSSIPGAVLNTLFGVIDFRLYPQVATDTPRILGRNGGTSVEAGWFSLEDGGVMATLRARGVNFTTAQPTSETYGLVQSIVTAEFYETYLLHHQDVQMQVQGAVYGAADVTRLATCLASGIGPDNEEEEGGEGGGGDGEDNKLEGPAVAAISFAVCSVAVVAVYLLVKWKKTLPGGESTNTRYDGIPNQQE